MKILILFFIIAFGFADEVQENATNSQELKTSLNPALIKEIKNFVESKFLEYYKAYNIKINYIEVAPTLDANLDKFRVDKIIFDNRDLRKDNGNFEVHLVHNQKRQKVFFKFSINAIIDALSATENIKSGTVLDSNNTTISQIQIAKNMQLPANKNILNEYSAKSFISSGSVIVDSKITPKIIVNKGDIIEVNYKIDNIDISFSAKALESGYINQIIKAQNIQSNKDIIVEILSDKSARLKIPN